MTINQRSKGQRGERELFALLSDQLGFVVRRNVDQVRRGGADGLDIPGWAIEVKRAERALIAPWWRQAVEQASRSGRRPALVWRANRRPWRACLRLGDVAPGRYSTAEADAQVEMDLATAVAVIRESLDGV